MHINIRHIRFAAALACAFALSISANAQDNAAGRLKAMLESGRISAAYKYDIDGKIPVNGSGTAILEGNCFRISGGGLDIYCDGSNIYTVDSRAKEVYVEKAENSGGWLRDPEEMLSQIKNLKYGSDSISGSITTPGTEGTLNFTLSGIKTLSPSGKKDEFSFDLSAAGPDWVITDLR